MSAADSPILCFFDGACRGNQYSRKGPMRVAYVVGAEEHVHEIPDLPTDRGPLRSNNIAEYQALILLLRRIRDRSARKAGTRFVVQGDSQLVIYQMQGRYRVREAHLAALHGEACRLAAGLPIVFRWMPRETNRAGHLLESR